MADKFVRLARLATMSTSSFSLLRGFHRVRLNQKASPKHIVDYAPRGRAARGTLEAAADILSNTRKVS